MLRCNFGEPWCKMVKAELVRSHNICFDELPARNDTHFSYLAGYYARTIATDPTPFTALRCEVPLSAVARRNFSNSAPSRCSVPRPASFVSIRFPSVSAGIWNSLPAASGKIRTLIARDATICSLSATHVPPPPRPLLYVGLHRALAGGFFELGTWLRKLVGRAFSFFR